IVYTHTVVSIVQRQQIMGDMKTPDFDDLLAAFDIPDMVDPKVATESNHQDDNNAQLKQTSSEMTTSEAVAPDASTVHNIGVSVPVKNVRTADPSGHIGTMSEKHHHFLSHPLSGNGHLNALVPTAGKGSNYKKNGWKASRTEGQKADNQLSQIHLYSPISSAEEFDDDNEDKIVVDDPNDNQENQSVKKYDQAAKLSGKNIVSKLRKNKNLAQKKKKNTMTKSSKCHNSSPYLIPKETLKENFESQRNESREVKELSELANIPSVPEVRAKSSIKHSSSIAAFAALRSKKSCTADRNMLDPLSKQREFIKLSENIRSPEKPEEQESAMGFAKRLLTSEPESPSSSISESSSTGSPDSNAETFTVIPKVRIKTIKTLSGQIKRTVTRVLPNGNTEESSKEETSSSLIAKTKAIFPSPPRSSLPTDVLATTGRPMQSTKQMTIKPVATAFLPVTAVKTTGSKVFKLKLSDNTTLIPATSVQNASTAILKAVNAFQQQTVMLPASSLTNVTMMSKTVNLTNLNILPQSVSPVTSDVQQALPALKQPQHQQTLVKQKALAGTGSKKVSGLQLFTSSKSFVVDAFNKVLSSINPVPVYIPNLSPPSAASIPLPSRGFKCLECGDSFALEKSLTQHHERRSVRIEVTCNQCAKSLVFNNKCRLLSHARDHKDKGVVMQCSHLILKPIPADQMISAMNLSGLSIDSTSEEQAITPQTPGTVSGAASQTAVISALCSAPLVAALPLEDDASKLCKHSLKCLECNEMFQDDSSLAMHYQQTVKSSGQKTCTICQMLLPNQCSFLSHQRIHQHKSPYICPECGAGCRSVHFQSHVTKNCLHYTRRVGYCCVHCSVIFADTETFKSHIQNTHCEIFYKCPLCPLAFKSAPAIHSHAYTQHPGVKPGEPKVIYKCSMCNTVFTMQSFLVSHFDQHVGNHMVSVFKCPDCSKHYAQKQLMLDHIKAIHGTLKSIEGPPNLGINLPLNTKPTNSMNTSNKEEGDVCNEDKGKKNSNSNSSTDFKSPPSSGYACVDCTSAFSTREMFVSHMRQEHGKILKKHPCRLCDKSFSSPHSLCRHNRLKHKGQRKVHTCPPALSQPITETELLDQRLKPMHEGQKPGQDMAEVPENNKNPKRKREDEGSPGLKSKGLDLQPFQRLKLNIPKVHRCAVCNFTTENIIAFHEHIPQHKSDGSSDQCRECGLCYTCHRSLTRHLFIVHRLKEPQSLGRFRKEDEESRRALDVTDENSDGTPSTKCKVCGKMFETVGNLNSHMRTHGMAFIRAKRLSNAKK
uniref:C2H2-type domain-containing protein n=1 Tax=Gouania willdenowi TaxID=441366 RepID=A0A8C5EU92_GOUWI